MAAAFLPVALALGHEGVVVKPLAAPYDAGRRGSAWVKVKPVHTLDLVVFAVDRAAAGAGAGCPTSTWAPVTQRAAAS